MLVGTRDKNLIHIQRVPAKNIIVSTVKICILGTDTDISNFPQKLVDMSAGTSTLVFTPLYIHIIFIYFIYIII
jgi:hypothetical protein